MGFLMFYLKKTSRKQTHLAKTNQIIMKVKKIYLVLKNIE